MGPLDEIHINGLPAAGDEQLTESGRAKAYNTCSTWRLVAERTTAGLAIELAITKQRHFIFAAFARMLHTGPGSQISPKGLVWLTSRVPSANHGRSR